jgi:hypothetical protein
LLLSFRMATRKRVLSEESRFDFVGCILTAESVQQDSKEESPVRSRLHDPKSRLVDLCMACELLECQNCSKNGGEISSLSRILDTHQNGYGLNGALNKTGQGVVSTS